MATMIVKKRPHYHAGAPHRGLERAAFSPQTLALLSDQLYEQLRQRLLTKGRVNIKVRLLDLLVIVFCYQAQAAKRRGWVPGMMNQSIRDMFGKVGETRAKDEIHV